VADPGALIVYGNGADLGNFKFFADDLKSMALGKKYKIIGIVPAMTRGEFFAAVDAFGAKQPIAELHIFTHAWGGGLSFGYDTHETNARRAFVSSEKERLKKKITYLEFLNTEYGTLFTDNLITAPYNSKRSALQSLFSPFATIKIWGCNSGISNWAYSDSNIDGSALYDPNVQLDENNEAVGYWWRALNTQNVPKPSAAQALADYFKRPVRGARSGSSIQVFHKKTWISSSAYKKSTTRWPGEAQLLRLQPDKGTYVEFKPSGK
jgi:hypothetical protein